MKECGLILVGILKGKGFYKEQNRRVYDPEGIAPSLQTMRGCQREPKIIIKGGKNEQTIKDGY